MKSTSSTSDDFFIQEEDKQEPSSTLKRSSKQRHQWTTPYTNKDLPDQDISDQDLSDQESVQDQSSDNGQSSSSAAVRSEGVRQKKRNKDSPLELSAKKPVSAKMPVRLPKEWQKNSATLHLDKGLDAIPDSTTCVELSNLASLRRHIGFWKRRNATNWTKLKNYTDGCGIPTKNYSFDPSLITIKIRFPRVIKRITK